MNHWNHRVVKRTHDCGAIEFAIHEAHYDENVAESITVNPTAPMADSVDELRRVLEQMLKALDKPVLNYEEF